MVMVRVNLDKEVSRAIHLPRFEDTPLYTRVPDCKEAYFDKSEEVANKSDGWIAKSKIAYGSPNNIRRVFITSEGVFVHLYQPIAFKGKAGNKGLTRERTYAQFKPMEVYESMMQGRRDYVVTKSGLGALANPWVASNIEEVYFDWSILLSEDILNLGFGNLLVDLTTMKTSKIERSELPYMLYKHFCCDGEDTQNKYPRLRVVGYIQQLARVYKMVDYKPGVETVEEMGKLWCTNNVVKAAGADPNCNILLYDVPNIPKLNTKYRTREGIYLYDLEVLQPYFEERNQKILKYKESVSKHQEEIKIDKSEIEVLLDEILERDGEEFVAKTIKIMFTNKEDGIKALNEMSTEGKKKYSRMFE